MMCKDITSRSGIFSIGMNMIKNDPVTIMNVLSNMIILHAESYYMHDTIKYHAYSPQFRVVATGEHPPEYDVIIEGDSIKFVERGGANFLSK